MTMRSEWSNAVSLLASKAVLLDQNDGFWSDPATLKYLWRRTGGVFADLEELIRRTGEQAIGGSERIDKGVLEGVRLSDEADLTAARLYGIGPASWRVVGRRGPRRRGSPGVSKEGQRVAGRLRKASSHGVGVVIDAQDGFLR